MYHGAEIANRTSSYQRIANLTTTSQEAKGSGSSPLAGRKYLYIWNQAGGNVFWSLDSTLAGSNVLTKATGVMEDGDQIVLPFGPNQRVYICTQSGQSNVAITEIA